MFRINVTTILAACGVVRRALTRWTPTVCGFYKKLMRGKIVNAGWVNPTDFEKQLL